jgi:hypothetical protein
MSSTSVTCPSCGAAHDLVNPGIIMFACEYCGTAVYWDQEKIRAAGTQATLPEGFSRLYRGAAGSLHQKRFVVLGRVRYSFGRGFWDEWYLDCADGKTRWLTEDNHELSWQGQIQLDTVATFESYRPGSLIAARDASFYVREVGTAECIGIEGDLPKMITTGETYPYVDASSPDGRYTLGIEYDDDTPTAFFGRWLKWSELKLDDEGVQW